MYIRLQSRSFVHTNIGSDKCAIKSYEIYYPHRYSIIETFWYKSDVPTTLYWK